MIVTEDLTKTFDEHLAVEGLTLTVAEGEVFGFLGPNGAGKTTTIRMLTCLIGPSGGRASVLGHEVGREDGAIRRRVGILTESPGHYDRLSAWKNLLIFARLYQVPDPEAAAEKHLRLLGLWNRRYDAAGTFSKGMRQKLALARALVHEPPVLFLDEPTAGLDPEMAKLVRDFIADLRAEGRTIFLCTHNLDEAERLCDRVAVFNTRLRVVDTPANLRRQLFGRQVVFHLAEPAEPYVAVVEQVPGVLHARAMDSRLIVTVGDPDAENPAIIRALVGAGAALQFVGELRRSLEDASLELVR